MKVHPNYSQHTKEHLDILNYYIKDIQKHGDKNIKPKFLSFLSNILNENPKPSIDKLSTMGNQYNDWLPGCGEVDNARTQIVDAQTQLIETCFRQKIIPKMQWFEKYHSYSNTTNSSDQLLGSYELVSWLNSPQDEGSAIKNSWHTFVSPEKLKSALQNFKEQRYANELEIMLPVKETATKKLKL